MDAPFFFDHRKTKIFVFPSRFGVFVFIKKSNILSSVKESFACLNVQRRYMKLQIYEICSRVSFAVP